MLSRRARKNNAWFLEQFKRPLNRQASRNASTIDLATAENWLIRPEILPILKKNAKRNLKSSHLSYAGGLGGTPELLAASSRFFNQFFSPKIAVKPEHVVTAPGCSAVLDTLINDICDDGDGILVAAPLWGSFEISAVLRNSVQLVLVHVPFNESHSAQAVVAAYRAAVEGTTCKVRGLLFCNPHNPHGHICPVEVIDALLQYCEESDVHFISDEIYALSTFGAMNEDSTGYSEIFKSPASQFVSVLSRDLQELGVDGSRVHLLYSISKDFGSSGLRFGCLITQANKELRMSQAILNNAKLCNAAAVMVTPMLNNISKLATLVDLNIRRLRNAALIAIQFAQVHGLTYYSPVSGLYIWLRLAKDCDTSEEEESIVQRCAQQGVLVGSGADYAESQAGWFRLTFALSEQDLLSGLLRVEAAMGYKEKFKYNHRGQVISERLRRLCL